VGTRGARSERLRMTRLPYVAAWLACAGALAACGGGAGGGPPPPSMSQRTIPGDGATATVFDTAYDTLQGGPCDVSYDGLVWYHVAAGAFAPLDVTRARCSSPSTLGVDAAPPVPAWAKPASAVHALFVATSYQQDYSPPGMMAIHALAAPAHIPMTWMLGTTQDVNEKAALYDQYHTEDGDDVESAPEPADIMQGAVAAFPWYHPAVAVEGAGRERDIAHDLQLGEHAFWGITWNSLDVDNTSDMGAPWGTYCADVTSYKRPSPSGDCTMLSFEWTARDLTRGYETGHTEYFSTDPDDVLVRAKFTPQAGAAYVSALVDAYAAASESQPLVVVAQQESVDMETGTPGETTVLGALYRRAVADGMTPLTLAAAAIAARAFSAAPRAVAFPFIAGGVAFQRKGSTLEPSTIDFHDNVAGMTFEAGHTTPSRVFEYSADPQSFFDKPLALLAQGAAPQLTMVAASGGKLFFHFQAPAAIHYGIALWGNPATLGIAGKGVAISGRAGAVAAFDLPSGASDVSVGCRHCAGATLPLAE
jgi:hypothetical protein